MKRYVYAALMLALGLAWGCEQAVEPLVHTAPRVEFPMGDEPMEAVVGTPVEFAAEVVAGDRLTCGWYVDEVLEASTPRFSYTFLVPGTYRVRFEARNGSGAVERSYTVTVSDVLRMHLSVGDSLRVERKQLDRLKVMAVVDAGSDVAHEWRVDGRVMCREAYFDTFDMPEAKVYTVAYRGENSAGSFARSFEVSVRERRLEVSFDPSDRELSCKEGERVRILATVRFGGTGIRHAWTVDGEEVSAEECFEREFPHQGTFAIAYLGVNGKGERVEREWRLAVLPSGKMLDDFEGYETLPAWWRLKENSPGITLEENPKREGINTSATVLRDQVSGTGGTSGYFTLETSKILEGRGIDVSKCSGIRFKVYLGRNRYYPRVDIGGVKYAPVSEPQFKDEWEVLEYRFPFRLDPTKIIQFRPLLQQNGSNIASGPVSDTNTRTVYIDDIELLE